jgi:hypothetical protein
MGRRGPAIGKTGRAAASEALAAVYKAATHLKPIDPRNLAEATGDPLADTKPDKAALAYGIADAPRPRVALRKVREAVYGDALGDTVAVARDLLDRRAVWASIRARPADPASEIPIAARATSAVAAAEMAVTLLATRGTWIGVKAPLPFREAVDRVRKAMARHASHVATGDTGRTLQVRPVMLPDGTPACIRMPDRAWDVLPPEGTNVPDNRYWRRRLKDGDVIRLENSPTE